MIKVKYSCALCGIRRREVDVPARGTEDVVAWLRDVATPALIRDHQRTSPHCQPTSLSEVMIPVSGTEKVGGPVVQ